MKFKLFLLALLCSNSAHADLPDWILNPPNKSGVIYGLGEGRTLTDSERDALSKILGVLKTTVSANFQMKEQLVNDSFLRTVNQSINTSIEKLPISQYDIEKRYQAEKVIYTLISVNKGKLASTFENEITEGIASARHALASKGVSGSELEWWVKKKPTLLTQYATNIRYLNILNSLEVANESLTQQNTAIGQELIKIRQANCLYVKPIAKRDIQLALREQIVAAGLPADNNQCKNTIAVNDTSESRELFNQYVTTVTLSLTLQKNGTSIAIETLIETGTSNSHPSISSKAAYSRLVSAIRNSNGQLLTQLLSN